LSLHLKRRTLRCSRTWQRNDVFLEDHLQGLDIKTLKEKISLEEIEFFGKKIFN
jgi:hypothetical protein